MVKYEQEYHLGEPLYPLRRLEASTRRGTTVRFRPSSEVFTHIEFHYDILAKRLRELSFLNSGVKIELIDERVGKSDIFQYEGGIKSFVEHLAHLKMPLHETVITLGSAQEGIGVDVAMQWTDAYQETVFCFTNNIPQKDGGTHISGFPRRAHAHAGQLHRVQQPAEIGKSRLVGRRHARRPDRGPVRQNAGPEIFFADERQTRFVGSEGSRRVHHQRAAGRISARESHRGASKSRPRSSTQRARAKRRAKPAR